MGPTATGKTDIAVELVQQMPTEIISVDSAMVYKGMDIGTAKPEPEVLAKAPHHLIDICDPANAYSAAKFRSDALQIINEIKRHHKIPLLVGGTGLYFKSLEQGLSPLPEADSSIRLQLEAERREKGLDYLYQRLQKVDPTTAKRISQSDPQRIQRALEVFLITGKPMSELIDSDRGQSLQDEVIKITLMPGNRETHREACAIRFKQMLQAGLIDEVRQFYDRQDLTADLPSMRLVGYRQVWRYLDGQLNYEEMQKHAIIATRQLAKRQMTWFRKDPETEIIDSEDKNKFEKVMNCLKHRLKIG